MIEQTLRQQGYSDENIKKIMAIMADKEAYDYALKTGNAEGAYAMIENKEKKENHNLMEFFSSFSKEVPEDAKSLSIALTKFSRWVQSQTDKNQEKEA